MQKTGLKPWRQMRTQQTMERTKKTLQEPELVLVNQSPLAFFPFAHTETSLVLKVMPKREVHDIKGYYRFLGLEPGASEYDVKTRGRRLALELHPDMGGDVEGFIRLQEILSILLDPVKKEAYDGLPPESDFFTPEDLSSFVASARIKGDVRDEEEILKSLGIRFFEKKERGVDEEQEHFFFPYSFYCESPTQSVSEEDLRLLSEWHDMLVLSAIRCGWKSSLRVGIRRSLAKAFTVERRSFAGFSTYVLVIRQGAKPLQRNADIAVSLAASDMNYSEFFKHYSKTVSVERGE